MHRLFCYSGLVDSSEFGINFYWISQLRQANHSKLIQSLEPSTTTCKDYSRITTEVHGSFSLGKYLGKKHRARKISVFVHCSVSECLANQPTTVLELGLSVALFEINRTIWQDFFPFLWFILPRATFLVTYYILLSWNIENLLLNHHILTTCVA